jgi:hydrogenase expression/formation protein HypE
MSGTIWGLHCPVQITASDERIGLAHGEGGRLARRLIRDAILPKLGNATLDVLGDSAALPPVAGRLAFTTDSFVVWPLFFPGGDIGRLAVFGTVNDLAVAGACPRWLSVSLIIEEGLPKVILERVLSSMRAAAAEVGVQVVAGDTKVVPRGAADGLLVNTAGIGELIDPIWPGPVALIPGDELLVSGPIGQHGMAVLAAREDLGFDPPPQSDCGPLVAGVDALRREGLAVRAARDATRGGVAAVLHEWAEASGRSLLIDEMWLPVRPAVRGMCELLGLDPVHVANEGTMVVAVEAGSGERAVDVLRQLEPFREAALIGRVLPRGVCPVLIRRALGAEQPLDEPAGAPLPRIC